TSGPCKGRCFLFSRSWSARRGAFWSKRHTRASEHANDYSILVLCTDQTEARPHCGCQRQEKHRVGGVSPATASGTGDQARRGAGGRTAFPLLHLRALRARRKP